MNGKKVGVNNILVDIFKYHKVTITTILSLCLINSTFNFLGGVYGAFSILTILLIYCGIIPLPIYKQIFPKNLSELQGYKQAKKVCAKISTLKTPHGIFDLFGLVGGGKGKQTGGGGNNLINEIKKLSKQLNKQL